MSYPVKYRERTIEYYKEGHTLKETSQTFQVAISTIQKWKKQLEVEGNLKNKPLNRGFKKIDPEKLQEYIKKHPDAYLKEIAQEFNCSDMAVYYALKRLKITRKKKRHNT